MTDSPRPKDPRSIIAERRHLAFHAEHREECRWDLADALNDGCYIRYRRYIEAYALNDGHRFDVEPVQVIHPNDLPAEPDRFSVPVPPHQHRDGHDPIEWDATCCACQNQSYRPDQQRRDLFIDEDCPACRAQRDQDRPYILLEWAVVHPSGVTEESVPERLARRGVKDHPEQTLLFRERVVTPDVVGDYQPVITS